MSTVGLGRQAQPWSGWLDSVASGLKVLDPASGNKIWPLMLVKCLDLKAVPICEVARSSIATVPI